MVSCLFARLPDCFAWFSVSCLIADLYVFCLFFPCLPARCCFLRPLGWLVGLLDCFPACLFVCFALFLAWFLACLLALFLARWRARLLRCLRLCFACLLASCFSSAWVFSRACFLASLFCVLGLLCACYYTISVYFCRVYSLTRLSRTLTTHACYHL